jgi:hypothetical protein
MGFSLSPVFVRQTVVMEATREEDGSTLDFLGVGEFFLLGLMHGHWDIKESKMNETTIEHDRKRGVNMGIAMVVPASKIIAILESKGFMDLRKQVEDKFRKESVPGMDSAKRQESEQNTKRPFSKEDFTTALRKVSRKITPKK